MADPRQTARAWLADLFDRGDGLPAGSCGCIDCRLAIADAILGAEGVEVGKDAAVVDWNTDPVMVNSRPVIKLPWGTPEPERLPAQPIGETT